MSLTGGDAVSRIGSMMMLYEEKIDIARTITAAKMARDTVVEFDSPLCE
jgi:hypothetical protein